ncbi:MAG: hypothetical protein H6Q33_4149, partial [Deltaproteobacteria bacterium]|nr:hypothetical protein [Deltaproteobacteria bacterium]
MCGSDSAVDTLEQIAMSILCGALITDRISSGRRFATGHLLSRRDRDPPRGAIEDPADLSEQRHAVGMQGLEEIVATFGRNRKQQPAGRLRIRQDQPVNGADRGVERHEGLDEVEVALRATGHDTLRRQVDDLAQHWDTVEPDLRTH